LQGGISERDIVSCSDRQLFIFSIEEDYADYMHDYFFNENLPNGQPLINKTTLGKPKY